MLIDPNLARVAPQSATRPAVKIDGISKSFDGATALDTTWLKIRRGEFLTLLGPSGCGKSTLLNLVAGFLEADRGEIFIDDALVTQTPAHKREIGIVFQNYALFPHMSVLQNVAYGLRTRGIGRAEARARALEALGLVKLQDFANRRPRQLSGGQQQRVALARALVIRPKVLLLDEPFSALDRNLRATLQVELKEIQQRLGVTTIFVTHDQDEALSMSDRIAVMSHGKIRQIDTPQEIYQNPVDRYVGTFVGDANLFDARITARSDAGVEVEIGGAVVPLSAQIAPEVPIGQPVELFARPEACRLVAAGTPGTLPSEVANVVYQGAHVQVYIACTGAIEGQAMVRVPATAAFKTGDKVALELPRSPAILTKETSE